ncbi:MAG: hypothetical protein COV99_06725 [Bacteroidetes bacterium CG12_big_fil_rev_8_21_14_0_65_60_17]|nr:MAG: hypothetical protein COV99_06725 [Bacteroidetes bacterium CG12_big_fil_rev_8_21_14_0_65_60_17]
MEQDLPHTRRENVDHIVDSMLRDRDFLLAQEIKLKVDELNDMLRQSARQDLKVELDVVPAPTNGSRRTPQLEVRVLKEL